MSLPLVYSCSGCSSAAQMANAFALRLQRDGLAEMSCIAGVGGAVPALLRVARQERPILALDGCALRCVAACLRRAGVQAFHGVNLAEHGVKKGRLPDFCAEEASRVWRDAVLPAVAALHIDAATAACALAG